MVLGRLSKLDTAPQERSFRRSALWSVEGLPLLLVSCGGGWRFLRRNPASCPSVSPEQDALCSRIAGQLFSSRREAQESLQAGLWLIS